jgi:hypothetical protein
MPLEGIPRAVSISSTSIALHLALLTTVWKRMTIVLKSSALVVNVSTIGRPLAPVAARM